MIAGLLSVGIGVIGIFVPLLPTVPLLLLAAFCFARSSDRLHDWLMNHPRLGPPIEDWNSTGAIRMPAKIAASVAIGLGFAISLALGVAPWALALQACVLACVALFIWTRPNGS